MQLAKYRGKYCVYWRDSSGQPVRRSLGTDELDVARRRFEDFRRLADARRDAQGLTVSDWWQRKVEALGKRRKAANMEWSGRAILPFFGHLELRQITDDLCKEYITHRKEKGRKDGTILTELSHLQSVLSFAKSEVKMVYPPRPPPKDLYLTKEQVRLLLDSANIPHIRLFILLACNTGARSGALLELTWDRIDLERRQIDLRTQEMTDKKGRAIVPINESLYSALNDVPKDHRVGHVIQWSGERVLSVKKGVRAVALKADLPFASPHTFRHSAAVWMAEAGVSMEEIAQFLGHSDVGITRRVYARFSSDHLRKAAQALEL